MLKRMEGRMDVREECTVSAQGTISQLTAHREARVVGPKSLLWLPCGNQLFLISVGLLREFLPLEW